MRPHMNWPSQPVEMGDYSARYECGCSATRGAIDLCKLHHASPELLAAAEEVLGPNGLDSLVHLEIAVARAKGVEP